MISDNLYDGRYVPLNNVVDADEVSDEIISRFLWLVAPSSVLQPNEVHAVKRGRSYIGRRDASPPDSDVPGFKGRVYIGKRTMP